MASELMAPSPASASDLAARFDRLASRLRRVALWRGLGRLAVTAAALCALALLVDWFWPLGEGLRIGWLAVASAVLGYTLWTHILTPVFRRFTAAELAAIVESQYPELGERLTSTIELTDPNVPEDHKGSALMREWLESETLASVTHLNFGRAVATDRAKKSAFTGLAALVILLLPFFFMPSVYGQLWLRLLMPWGANELPAELYFHIPNGDRVAARGEDLTILALPPKDEAIGDLPEAVDLLWTNSAGEIDRRPMQYVREKQGFLVTLPHVFEGFSYQAVAKRKRSEKHTITVVDRPEITAFVLTAMPPKYTKLPELKADGAVGNVMVFERSQIRAELEFNKPVAKADWLWQDAGTAAGDFNVKRPSDRPSTLPFRLSEDKKSATLELLASEGWFAVRLQDEHGLANAEEPARNLIVIPDRPPVLKLSGQTGTTRARGDDVIQLEANAQDDIAVAALELHIETAKEEATKILATPAEKLGQTEIAHAFTLDLATFNLADGEWLTYRVRAADNRPVPAPNEVWSEERRILIDPEAELPGTQEIVNRQNELKDVLEAIRKDLIENRKATAALKTEAENQTAKGELFEKQAELAALEKQQRELADRLEQLALKFGEHRLFANLTPETQRIAREPISQAAAETQKAGGGAETKHKALTLEKSQNSLAAAEADLEKLARRFDELAALERDLLVLPRLARQAERVADQALELAKQRDNPPPGETPAQKAAREAKLQEEQAAVEAERQELADALDDLLNHRPEVLEAARKTALEEIAELSQKASALADRQDRLTESLESDAQKAAKEAAPVAEHQADLVKQAENLKPSEKAPEEAKQARTASPLDPEELRKVLEALKAGNLAAAAKQQQAIADRLETLAAELKKNEKLPKDPQKAAQELAARERELQKKIAEAAKQEPAENAGPAEREAFEKILRKLAEAQTGLQAGIVELDAPPLAQKSSNRPSITPRMRSGI